MATACRVPHFKSTGTRVVGQFCLKCPTTKCAVHHYRDERLSRKAGPAMRERIADLRHFAKYAISEVH